MLASAAGRAGANHRLAICACCCSRDDPDTNEGHEWMLGKRHSKKCLPGPYSQCRPGGPGWDQRARGGGHWGPTAAPPPAQILARVLAARGWEPFSLSSTRRALSSQTPLPPQTIALCPLPPHRYGPERPVSCAAQLCQRKGTGPGGGRGEGEGTRVWTQQAHLRAERTDGRDGNVGRTECRD